jgi:hypothetical protein
MGVDGAQRNRALAAEEVSVLEGGNPGVCIMGLRSLPCYTNMSAKVQPLFSTVKPLLEETGM